MVKIKLSDGTELYYKIIGQGPLIVLNHGYGSSHKSVKYVAEHLKDSFSCLLYDQRGQGDSDKTIGDSYDETLKMYTLDQLSDDCYDLLKQLNFIDNPEIGKFFMYGHSMGGMISLLYAIKYGESLKGLCVGSTTANGYDPEWSKMLSEYKNGSIQFTEETFRENAKLG
ncbi:MAG: alpha/beta hydrolase, partial [archaeon]|nr:alpha/beta hydrolase [archaeon]